MLPFLSSSRANVVALALAGAGLVVPALESVSAPFLWLALLWGLAALILVRSTALRWLRMVLINAGLFLTALAPIEGYLWTAAERDLASLATCPEGYFVPDDVLGYRPVPETSAVCSRWRKGRAVYQVRYSIGSNGLRVSPPHDVAASEGCVLFFGCSYTYGEGVEDRETMPYRVGVRTEGRFQVHNFGFHGYGPHQMLAALEHGLVDLAIDRPPTHLVYLALAEHVGRAAGLAPFGKHGPRYELRPGNRLVYTGHFDEPAGESSVFGSVFWPVLQRSFTCRRLSRLAREVGEEELRLYLEIVAAARDRARASWPEAQFHVLFWETGEREGPLDKRILAGLAERGLVVHPVADVLPGFAVDLSPYRIGPADGHPNALAHDLVARYIVQKILARRTEGGPAG